MVEYNAQSIETLSFRDAIRSRVAMYMGRADNMGVLQCLREIITNSIDEATMGFGKKSLWNYLRIIVYVSWTRDVDVLLVNVKMVLKLLKLFIPWHILALSLMTRCSRMLLV